MPVTALLGRSTKPEAVRDLWQSTLNRYLTAHVFSTFGIWGLRIGIDWSAWEVTQSALWSSTISALTLLPNLYLSLLPARPRRWFGFKPQVAMSPTRAVQKLQACLAPPSRWPSGYGCVALFPTGTVVDTILGTRVTLIDNGMPCAIIDAADFDLTGTDDPDALEARPGR